MSMTASRINLLPTARTLATGVPFAPKLNRSLPPAKNDYDHGHSGGPRGDIPKPWAGYANQRVQVSMINGRCNPTQLQRRFSTSSTQLANGPGANTQATVSHAHRSPTGVPDFSPYRAKNGDMNKTLSYFMVGSLGVLAASGAKSTVSDILSNMAASADVLALAKIEVEMGSIPEGKNLIVKWRGKPVFIRHRTADEIDEANKVDVKTLRDPQSDEERVQRPEWLVMLGVCTHLGCVPIGEAGDYGGWFCPCHGSHYDISGRIRRGPAPLNLEVPEYSFDDEGEKLVIG